MSDVVSKNKALMRRIYEEMWNKAKPALAVEIFAQPAILQGRRMVNLIAIRLPGLKTYSERICQLCNPSSI